MNSIVARAMAKAPHERYPTAAAMQEALAAARAVLASTFDEEAEHNKPSPEEWSGPTIGPDDTVIRRPGPSEDGVPSPPTTKRKPTSRATLVFGGIIALCCVSLLAAYLVATLSSGSHPSAGPDPGTSPHTSPPHSPKTKPRDRRLQFEAQTVALEFDGLGTTILAGMTAATCRPSFVNAVATQTVLCPFPTYTLKLTKYSTYRDMLDGRRSVLDADPHQITSHVSDGVIFFRQGDGHTVVYWDNSAGFESAEVVARPSSGFTISAAREFYRTRHTSTFPTLFEAPSLEPLQQYDNGVCYRSPTVFPGEIERDSCTKDGYQITYAMMGSDQGLLRVRRSFHATTTQKTGSWTFDHLKPNVVRGPFRVLVRHGKSELYWDYPAKRVWGLVIAPKIEPIAISHFVFSNEFSFPSPG